VGGRGEDEGASVGWVVVERMKERVVMERMKERVWGGWSWRG